MNFRVIMAEPAEQDVLQLSRWFKPLAPQTAAEWVNRLLGAIESLNREPRRCPLIKNPHRFPQEVRELLFGKLPHVIRITFFIREDIVTILRVVRAQRRSLSSREVKNAMKDPS